MTFLPAPAERIRSTFRLNTTCPEMVEDERRAKTTGQR